MEIANLSRVDKDTRDEVLDEFLLIAQARRYMLEGGVDYARDILEKTLGHHKAMEIIKRLKEQVKVKPFTFASYRSQAACQYDQPGTPQTIALILSYLDSQQAAIMLFRSSGRNAFRNSPAHSFNGPHFP